MDAEASGGVPTGECLIGVPFERRGSVDCCREIAKHRQGCFRGSQNSGPRRGRRTGKVGKGGGRMVGQSAGLSRRTKRRVVGEGVWL